MQRLLQAKAPILRRSISKLITRKTGRIETAQEFLGHFSIKITVDIYGHLVPGEDRQAVNRLPSLGGFQALKQKEKKG